VSKEQKMKKTIEIINKLKEERLIKDYAIGGAIGVLRWVEPFFTRDLDIFIIPFQEPKGKVIDFSCIYDSLKKKGYSEWIGQWIMIEDIPVEFIPAENLAKESVIEAQEIEFEGIKTKVITPEYLIALLLRAGREKDIMKIKMLLEQAKVDRKKLNEILIKYDLDSTFKLFMKEP
jgi:predicted nucleotidyltransferase